MNQYTSMRKQLLKISNYDPYAFHSAQAQDHRGDRTRGHDVASKYFVPIGVGLGAGLAIDKAIRSKGIGSAVLRAPGEIGLGKKLNKYMDRKNLKLTGSNLAGLATGAYVTKKLLDRKRKNKETSR